jgi:hypothetical protein
MVVNEVIKVIKLLIFLLISIRFIKISFPSLLYRQLPYLYLSQCRLADICMTAPINSDIYVSGTEGGHISKPQDYVYTHI